MTKLLVQVQEWERLPLTEKYDTPQIRERLLAAGQTTAGPAFRSTGRHLFARDFVGLIDAGFLQVQIVPKLYDDSTSSEEARSLCDLLLRSGLPIKPVILPARIREGRLSLLEGLYKHVAEECNRLLMRGTPRRYSSIEEVAQVIRGRVRINQVARRRTGTDHLVPLRYAPLQQDNPLSRTLRAMAAKLEALTRVSRTRLMFQRCGELLHGASRCPLTSPLVQSVRLSRLEQEWTATIEFAEMLARNSVPDVLRSGKVQGFAFLFQLDGLFESIIRAAARRALYGTPLNLRQDRGAGFLLRRNADSADALPLKPDLLIESADTGQVVLVADVKWKRLDTDKVNLGIGRDDFYQLVAYMERCDVKTGVLILPMTSRSERLVTVHEFVVLPNEKRISVLQIAIDQLLDPNSNVRQSVEHALRTALLTTCRLVKSMDEVA